MNSDATTPALTPKQLRFVQEYLIDLNATQAAIRAGYSKRTANEQGSQLLSRPDIKAAIDAAKIKRSDRTQIDADYVLTRLFNEVNADLADLYTACGELKPIEEWPPIWRTGLVQGVETEELFDGRGDDRVKIGRVKKIRLSDRLRRLELIGRHIKVNAFQENVHHIGLDALGDRLERARARMRGEQAVIVDAAPVAIAMPAQQVPPADSRPAGKSVAPANQADKTTPAEPSAAGADWVEPSATYRPVGVPWPQKQAFADCNYEDFEGGLVRVRK